jgi:hypothetical protein
MAEKGYTRQCFGKASRTKSGGAPLQAFVSTMLATKNNDTRKM